MSTPYEWRINDIERDAKRACDSLWKHDAIRSDVANLEYTVRELSSCIDGLRSALETTLNRVEQLERTIEEIKPTLT